MSPGQPRLSGPGEQPVLGHKEEEQTGEQENDLLSAVFYRGGRGADMGPVSPFSLPPPFSLLGAFFKATFFSLHPHFQTHLFSSFNLCTSAHLTPFFLGACATALTMATQTRPCWLFSWIWIPCYLPSYSALALGGGGCIFHPLLPLPSLLSFYVLV